MKLLLVRLFLIFIFEINVEDVWAQSSSKYSLTLPKDLCRADNITTCLPVYHQLKLRELPITSVGLIQLGSKDIKELCIKHDCLKLDIKKVSQLTSIYRDEVKLSQVSQNSNLANNSRHGSHSIGTCPDKEKSNDPKLALRLFGGTSAYNFIGATGDFPRTVIFGVGAGVIFCHGKCETFAKINGAVGSKNNIVDTKYKEIEGKVGFIWMPITIKERVKFGIGPDISLRRGQLDHRYDDAKLTSDILSLTLGINLNTEVKIIDLNTDKKKKKSITLSVGLDSRFYLQTLLKACNSFSDQKGSSIECYNQDQLRSLDAVPVNGFGIDSSLYLKGTFN